MKYLTAILFGLLLTGIGLVAGHHLASVNAPSGPNPEAEDAQAAHAAATPELGEQALRGLGVEVRPAARSDFVLTRRVQAVVVDPPLNERPVTAPLGGLVVDLLVEVGKVVEPGEDLVVIARDPIPRPKPELTADVLAPLNESVHDTAARLRSAVAQLEATKRELARIEPFVEERTIPMKTAIDLRYTLDRQRQEVLNARVDLQLHGLREEEIEAVEKGGNPPLGRSLWKRVLEEHGLWGEEAESMHTVLSDAGCPCDLPWCVAAIGELTSMGLATRPLVEALEESDVMRQHFADVAGLLLDGMPLDTVRTLAETGALEPRIVMRAPGVAPADWDVTAVEVRPGQRVEAGDTLLRLHDARRMALRLHPVGAEIPLVVQAVEQGTTVRAVPLVKGAGPTLESVRIARLLTQAGEGGRGGSAIAGIENSVLEGGDSNRMRSWALREGTRYLVEVPVASMPGRFVLPFDAVTERGAERIVFLADGKGFRAQAVHVEYEDDEIVVLADDGSLFEGDPVVVRGAFALGLALDRGTSPPEPGHGHAHN